MVKTRKGSLRSNELAQSGSDATQISGHGSQGRPAGENELITRSTLAKEVTRAIQEAIPAIFQQINENTRKMIEDKVMVEKEEKQSTDNTQKLDKDKFVVVKEDFSECMPEFNGVCDLIAAMRWIFEMENIFKAIKCTDEEKAKYAVNKLRSEALIWWAMVNDTSGSSMTWNEFKDVFKEKYCPLRMVMQLEEEFMAFKQGIQTVQEYTARFVEMARFAEHQVATEGRKIERYIRGLKPYIRDFVSEKKLGTFQEAVKAAQEIENEKNRYAEKRCNFKRKNEGNDSKGWCYRCGNHGHVARDCLTTGMKC